MSLPKVRPLLIRSGARYTCFGDGICCSDIHGLGALDRREVVQIRRLDRNGAHFDEVFDDFMLKTKPDGTCVFLLDDLRCSIHANLGHEKKPSGCRRFPLGLVATPLGGRVTTEHRCPCRTMGARPALEPARVEPSLRDGGGRITADRRVETVRLEGRRRISFDRYLTIERDLLDALLSGGATPEAVLGVAPFPKLRKTSWKKEAEGFLTIEDETQFGYALRWFADAILVLTAKTKPRRLARPWAHRFDRAERRSPDGVGAEEVLVDWVADEIWGLRWTDLGSFALARAELVTRLAIARHIVKRLTRQKVRPDRAAAEALMIVDLLGSSDYWKDLLPKFPA